MRKTFSNILIGIFFIAIGIGYAGNAAGIWGFDLFFDGWWTFFIIIPCIAAMIRIGFDWSNVIGLFIGIALLLAAQDIVTYELLAQMIVPIILIGIGIRILFRDWFRKRIFKAKTKNVGKMSDINAIFGHSISNFSGEVFKGADINTVFGGVDLYLRDAIITEDVVISCNVVFGGVNIMVPDGVKIKVSSTPIFGGVKNGALFATTGEHTIFIEANCVIGGVDIK
jgi:predicted membrane protein